MNQIIRDKLYDLSLHLGLGPKFWTIWPHLGDEAIIIPAMLAIALILGALRGVKAALVWSAACGGCFAVILLLKMLYVAYGPVVIDGRTLQLMNPPSGHAGMSTVLYGGLAILVWRAGYLMTRLAAIGLVLVALIISLAMFIPGYHSLIDVSAGWLIGITSLTLIWIGLPERPKLVETASVLCTIVALCAYRELML